MQVAESQSEARAKEKAFLDAIPPEGGLIEMSQWFGVDFSLADPEMTLADFTDLVCETNGNLGTFEEILRTTSPNTTVKELGRDYLTKRIMAVEGTPKAIVDKLERVHFETGTNGGFILGRGYHAMNNIRDFVDLVVPELQRRGLCKKEYSSGTLKDNFND